MIRILLPALVVACFLASCTGFKPLGSAVTSRVTHTTPPVSSTPATNSTSNSSVTTTNKEKVKFLDDISVSAAQPVVKEGVSVNKEQAAFAHNTSRNVPNTDEHAASSSSLVNASAFQVKYSALLNTSPELLENTVTLSLLQQIDEWYGTRYRMGGTTKSGIDCSAFVQTIYSSAYGTSIPRTAAEQFRVAKIISATELKEGDLVFFNTTGGVSHVGMYLANNKFVHASSSDGVKISDLFENYYLRRYLGAGRIEKPQAKN